MLGIDSFPVLTYVHLVKNILLSFIFLLFCCGISQKVSAEEGIKKLTKVGSMKATIETKKGNIVIELYPEEAPVTVASFVNLIQHKFYDGIIFHRVVPGFVIQGGDPQGMGFGGPGYQFEDECTPKRKHFKAGILSMANSGPGTNGSQFFVTLDETPWLDGKHTVFGEVTSGMEVVTAIKEGDVMTHVTVEGDTKPLLEKYSERVAKWNAAIKK
jgi:peptidyl-prolyl cis-trans isomerase B (cyclophilin B)